MTEKQWLACATNPTWMVNAIRNQVTDRKLRLFAVACVRSILPRAREIHREDVARAADIAEAFAEGTASVMELEAARRDTIPWDNEIAAAIEACNPEAQFAAVRTVRAAADAALGFWLAAHPGYRRRSPEASAARRTELEQQTALALCVFGNPFRPLPVDPAWMGWHDGTVPRMALAIYQERRFEDLPILADALEDAGCNDADILGHCRSHGDHVRGCWVIDLLLNKA